MSQNALMALIYAFCGMNVGPNTIQIKESKIACMENVLNCAIKGNETILKEDKLRACLTEENKTKE